MKASEHKIIFFVVTTILMCIYLVWRLFFTLPLNEGVFQATFGVMLMVAEVVTVFTTFELYYRKVKSEDMELELPDIPEDEYPDVDVFIATHNESIDLLYKTANACTYMVYPDQSKVHIYFCDDGNRKEVAELAKKLKVGYLGLANNKDAKSGNLNHALSYTKSPLIATFDADMIPKHTFLMKTVPYFLLPYYIKEEGEWRKRLDDELDKYYKIGLIQTPQSFYNPDLFQFNLYSERSIPNEQDFFSKEVNILRNSSNAIAYTGSNTVISRRAMEEIGGFPLKTITEDFETSIRIQKKGYVTYATKEVQAAGLSTTTVPSMIKQRIRWARGVIQSIQNTNAVFTSELSLGARITYLNAFLYWWSFFNRMIFIMAPILFALFDLRVVDTTFEEILIFWLPGYLLYSMSMKYLSGNIRNQRWSQVIDTVLTPYLIVPVLLETLHIHQRKFKVTNKNKEVKQNSNFIYAIPHMLLTGISMLAMMRFIHGKYGWALIYSSVIIFWLGYNLIAILYALFFMMGRRSPRSSERIKAEVEVILHCDGKDIHGKSVDVSDGGMAVWLDDMSYLTEEMVLELTVRDSIYEARLKGKEVYVKEEANGWTYAMEVMPVDDKSKSQYSQIIYDRDHSLPVEMDVWSTTYDDLTRNIIRRLDKGHKERRKYPRLALNKKVIFVNGATGVIENFNYVYFGISHLKKADDKKNGFILHTKKGTRLVLKRVGRFAEDGKLELFRLGNLEELRAAGKLDDICEEL